MVDDPETWSPLYQIEVSREGGSRGKEMVPIGDLKIKECPVSFLSRHPKSIELLGRVTEALAVQQATGAMVYGPDSGKWPIWWFDLVMMINSEDYRVAEAEKLITEGK